MEMVRVCCFRGARRGKRDYYYFSNELIGIVIV